MLNLRGYCSTGAQGGHASGVCETDGGHAGAPRSLAWSLPRTPRMAGPLPMMPSRHFIEQLVGNANISRLSGNFDVYLVDLRLIMMHGN